MEGYGGPAQPSPTIAQCLNGGLGWLEVECNRCKTHASLPLDAIRRPRDTPIWKLEAALKCRSCRKGRYAPPVHMIKLTETREITPYVWGLAATPPWRRLNSRTVSGILGGPANAVGMNKFGAVMRRWRSGAALEAFPHPPRTECRDWYFSRCRQTRGLRKRSSKGGHDHD